MRKQRGNTYNIIVIYFNLTLPKVPIVRYLGCLKAIMSKKEGVQICFAVTTPL